MTHTMSLELSPTSHAEQWRTHLSEAGDEEFQQLHSLLSDDPEAFALFIVRSDFDTETRDALLQQLSQALAPTQMVTIALNNERFDVPFLLHEAAVNSPQAAFFAITGLEETPHLVSATGEKPTRPPALALLNHGREAIRQVEHPVLLWCDPIAYAALREHAPDFFDHYTALFDFLDAAPSPIAPKLLDFTLKLTGDPQSVSNTPFHPVSPESVRFYEEQVGRFPEPTLDRLRALMGLGHALFGFSDARFQPYEQRVEALLREALDIAQTLELRVETARIQAMLSGVLNRQRREGKLNSPEVKQEIIHLAEQSLEVFTESEFPIEWAASQWALGNYYEQTAEGEADRQRAIPYLQAAQRVWGKERGSEFWASTEMNLGQIYLDLPPTSRNLKHAVSHSEKALEGFKKLNLPHQWSLVQMMLGRAYSLMADLAEDDKNARSRHIRRAIASHQAAAHVFSQIKEIQGLAAALASEALLWRELPTGNRREHLRQSVNCLLKSADQLKQAGDGEGRAMELSLAAEFLMELGLLTKSSKEFEELLGIYRTAQKAFEELSNFTAAQEMQQKALQLREILRKAQAERKS